jgi:thiol-disulfide isomerase/thioredoxin
MGKSFKLLNLSFLTNKLKSFKLKSLKIKTLLILLGILLALYFFKKYFLTNEGFGTDNYETTPEEFEQKIQNKKSLVLFYANWCPHCKDYMPIWNEVSNDYNKSDKSVQIIKVDCGGDSEFDANLTKKYSIDGFPTIVFVDENGAGTKYDKGQDKSSIFDYLKTKE